VVAPFSSEVAALLFGPPLDEVLAADPAREEALIARARRLAERAYPRDAVSDRATDPGVDHGARDELHRALLACYQTHVRCRTRGWRPTSCTPSPAACSRCSRARGSATCSPARALRRSAPSATSSPRRAPADPSPSPSGSSARRSPTRSTSTRCTPSSRRGDARAARALPRLEAAGEAAFDDLVALGQVGTRGEVKIEMGRNYWDELGNGKSHAVHTHLFHRLTDALGIEAPEAHELPWQVLNGVNVMLWSCIPRRNAFRAQGTLGAVELLAPQRCTRLVAGATRVGHPQAHHELLRGARHHRRGARRGVARPRGAPAGGERCRVARRDREGSLGPRADCEPSTTRLLVRGRSRAERDGRSPRGAIERDSPSPPPPEDPVVRRDPCAAGRARVPSSMVVVDHRLDRFEHPPRAAAGADSRADAERGAAARLAQQRDTRRR
jgi:hypothetical protein